MIPRSGYLIVLSMLLLTMLAVGCVTEQRTPDVEATMEAVLEEKGVASLVASLPTPLSTEARLDEIKKKTLPTVTPTLVPGATIQNPPPASTVTPIPPTPTPIPPTFKEILDSSPDPISDLQPMKCSDIEGMKSDTTTQQEVDLEFRMLDNTGNYPLEIFWKDFQGKEVQYDSVAPGTSITISTYTEHLWVLRGTNGDCVTGFIVEKSDVSRNPEGISAIINLSSLEKTLNLATPTPTPRPAAPPSPTFTPTPTATVTPTPTATPIPVPSHWISSGGSTGPLVSLNDSTDALVIAHNPLESSIVMSSEYGEGKVLAFGHEGFLINMVSSLGDLRGSDSATTGNTEFDNDDFLMEAINWFGSPVYRDVKITTNHNEFVDWHNLEAFRDVLVQMGYIPSLIEGEITSSELSDTGILILGNAWGEINDNEISAVHNFVEAGGGLIMAGLGWSWLSYADDPNWTTALSDKPGEEPTLENYPMNKVAKAFGIQWADGVVYDNITDSHSIFLAYDLEEKLSQSASSKPERTPTPTPTPAVKATPVPIPEQNSIWMDRYMTGPGYNAEWEQPKKGGIFRYGASHRFRGHDPNYGHSFEGPQYLPTYNALLRYDPWKGLNGQIEGDLAETWEVQDGGKTVLFKLREGVNFQNNPNLPAEIASAVSEDSFTCEDAQASLDYAVNPPEGVDHEGWDSGHFKQSSCVDNYMFKVEFEKGLASTIAKFAGGRGAPNNMDKDFIEYIRQAGNEPESGILYTQLLHETTPETFLYGTGTGAFVPTEYEDGGWSSKTRANPDYWREGLPLIEGQDHVVITDSEARFSALLVGQIDYFGEGSASLSPTQVVTIKERYADDFTIMPTLHSWGKGLQINMLREPFDDARIRMAMHLAMDRDDWDELNRYAGLAGVHRHTLWMPPGSMWALPGLGDMPGWRSGDGKVADIVEANRLVDEALGAGKRFDFECIARDSDFYSGGCPYFVDQMNINLGLNGSVSFISGSEERDRLQTGDYDLSFGSKVWTQIGDPDDFYNYHLVWDTQSYNYRGLGRYQTDPLLADRLEQLALLQSAELDVSKRITRVHEIERILATQAMYSIPFPWTNIFPAWSNEVRGWQLYPHPSQNKWAQWERMWLDRE